MKHSNDIKAFPEGAGENVSLKPNGDFEPSPHRKTVNDRGTSCLTVKHQWQPIETAPAEELVWTKIHDEKGERNVAKLYREGRLWFLSDRSMYVYYTPTHWRHLKAGTYSQ